MTEGTFLRHLAPGMTRITGLPVVDDSRISLTGVELLRRISETQESLRGHVQTGDTVAVVLPSSASYLILQAALVDLGAVFIAVPSDALYLLDVIRSSCQPRWYALAPDSDIAEAIEDEAGLLLVDLQRAIVEIARQPRQGRGSDTTYSGRVVVATSGSTGEPKLVNLSPEAYWFAATSICSVTGVGSDDVLLHHLPIQRGACWLLWGSIALGARNLILPTRTPDLPVVLRDLDITATFSVSVGLAEMVDQDCSADSLPRLRTLYYSSGPVGLDLKRSLAERFGSCLVQDYGMTEVPEPVTVLTREDHVRGLTDPNVLSSVGKPLQSQRIMVRPSANPGTPGRVHVRSPYMFDGYWGDRLRTSSRWHETDDLGYFDPDGYLHLVGRQSDSVRSGGVSFPLRELRGHLLSLPGVVEVELAVVPDDRLGEQVRASVVVAADSGVDAETLDDQLRALVKDPRARPSEISISSTPRSPRFPTN